MSGPDHPDSEPITDKRRLVEHLEAGCKRKDAWRIGTEHEKFAFRTDDLGPVPYDGPGGIRAILEGLERFGWRPVREQGKPIALIGDAGSITLEPGGQFELSGAALETLHQTCAEVHEHLAQVKEVAGEDVGLLGIGFNPKWARAEMPWMPKGRYGIMKAYMPTKGNLGLDMMLRTCTVQVNLDFGSESDMVRKFRVGLALQPVATALFANSPFVEGAPASHLSYRSFIWTDTDPDRCGIRDGRYLDAAGQSFRDFMNGRLPALPGEAPILSDWDDHLTTVFPEVRLKRFLEMRGADAGPWRQICALPAFWVGLLYDQGVLDAAWDLVKHWTKEEHQYLRNEAPRLALATRFKGTTLGEVAREVLAMAEAGLKARDRRDKSGSDEVHHLDPLMEIAEAGRTRAEEMLAAYEDRWRRSVDPIFSEYAY
jgi:glutamate--cysteine ligase